MKIKMMIVTLVLCAHTGLFACKNIVINDTQEHYYVREYRDGTPNNWIMLSHGQEQEFGSKKQMPVFGVGQQDNGNVVEFVVVEQLACGVSDAAKKEKADKKVHLSHVIAGQMPDNLAPIYTLHDPQEMQTAKPAEKKAGCGCKK